MSKLVFRKKVVVGGAWPTFCKWLRENDLAQGQAYFVGHDEEKLLGLELKESDIVRLGGISHRMEETLRSRIR